MGCFRFNSVWQVFIRSWQVLSHTVSSQECRRRKKERCVQSHLPMISPKFFSIKPPHLDPISQPRSHFPLGYQSDLWNFASAPSTPVGLCSTEVSSMCCKSYMSQKHQWWFKTKPVFLYRCWWKNWHSHVVSHHNQLRGVFLVRRPLTFFFFFSTSHPSRQAPPCSPHLSRRFSSQSRSLSFLGFSLH